MQINKVKIHGNDNVLRYAIKNQADLLNDLELMDFVTADMVATITLTDVNFYELCRLSHHYRSKIRVLEEERIGDVDESYLDSLFPGEYKNSESGELISTGSIVKECCDRFMNLVLQMESDEDIIPTWAGRMFIPMLYRRFKVSIPIRFHEFAWTLKGTKMEDVFNTEDYQENIDQRLFTEDGLQVVNDLVLFFSKIIFSDIDSDRSSQLISIFKFQSLGKNSTDKLYHFTPIAFSKYNELGGFDQKVKFFNGNPDTISEEMASIARLKTPLKVEFAVQLPLHQLQVLERTFSDDDLDIDYLSRPIEIIGNGIRFDSFIAPEYDESDENREQLIEDHEAAISAYRERIKSATENTLAASALLLNSRPTNNSAGVNVGSYGPSGVVTLLPAIATTRAVITLDSSMEAKYRSTNDALNHSMLTEMLSTAIEINKSINRSVDASTE